MPDLNRIRDLRDEAGHVLRVGTQGWHRSVVLVLEDEAADGGQSIVLDSYGAEMLAGYIMAARMTVPDPLPVERIAEITKVSAYELITRLTSRVAMKYID